jgi:hypothetical protein
MARCVGRQSWGFADLVNDRRELLHKRRKLCGRDSPSTLSDREKIGEFAERKWSDLLPKRRNDMNGRFVAPMDANLAFDV